VGSKKEQPTTRACWKDIGDSPRGGGGPEKVRGGTNFFSWTTRGGEWGGVKTGALVPRAHAPKLKLGGGGGRFFPRGGRLVAAGVGPT